MLVKQAQQLRRNSTDAENSLWRTLRSRRLRHVKFRRQVPIGRYIVDFVAFEHRLVIEVDGGQHAFDDPGRTRYLELEGFRVLRFWNNEVLQNIEGVLLTIIGTIESR